MGYCVYARKKSRQRSVRMQESHDAFAVSILPFWFEMWRREDGETTKKDLWYPWDVIAAELKMQIFLCCTGLNVSSHFTLYYSCLTIHVYWVAGVCFIILKVKEACEGPTQVSRSEGRTKVIA